MRHFARGGEEHIRPKVRQPQHVYQLVSTPSRNLAPSLSLLFSETSKKKKRRQRLILRAMFFADQNHG
jgi:hypothetical protein